jgi:exosortase A-associated hydrolase 1
MHEERALSFACEGEQLVGIVSLPSGTAAPLTRGVLIVVGGPQYRAGSHRQFTLLARRLAAEGIAAMRFDYRGMGDSEGALRDFESVDTDLRCALDAFFAAVPSLREVALCGLCDGASASVFYAADDARVRGLVLLNPWVRTEEGAARATLQHYYGARLVSGDFWRKLLSGRFKPGAALASALKLLRQARGNGSNGPAQQPAASLPERMYQRLNAFRGRVLVVLSGADLTAQEFAGLAQSSAPWRTLLAEGRVTRHELPGADHTFSQRAWQDEAAARVCDWMRAW